MIYGEDLKDFSLGLAIEPLNFNFYNNDYFAESEVKVSSSSISSNASGYTSFATNQSSAVFSETSEQAFPTFEDEQLNQRLNTAVTLQKKVAEQKQVSLQGESTNTGVTLGKIIQIKNGDDSFGTYRVIPVSYTHLTLPTTPYV